MRKARAFGRVKGCKAVVESPSKSKTLSCFGLDALSADHPIEILARVAAQMGESDRAIAALQKLLAIPYESV